MKLAYLVFSAPRETLKSHQHLKTGKHENLSDNVIFFWRVFFFCLVREAKHPKIVEVIECISIQNQLAIVMEFMAGGNLKMLLDKNQGRGQGKEFTLRFTEDIGSALEHLHSLNIIHRDVKPENIFVRELKLYPACIFVFVVVFVLLPSSLATKGQKRQRNGCPDLTLYFRAICIYLY